MSVSVPLIAFLIAPFIIIFIIWVFLDRWWNDEDESWRENTDNNKEFDLLTEILGDQRLRYFDNWRIGNYWTKWHDRNHSNYDNHKIHIGFFSALGFRFYLFIEILIIQNFFLYFNTTFFRKSLDKLSLIDDHWYFGSLEIMPGIFIFILPAIFTAAYVNMAKYYSTPNWVVRIIANRYEKWLSDIESSFKIVSAEHNKKKDQYNGRVKFDDVLKFTSKYRSQFKFRISLFLEFLIFISILQVLNTTSFSDLLIFHFLQLFLALMSFLATLYIDKSPIWLVRRYYQRSLKRL